MNDALEDRCRKLALFRMRAECLRAQTIVDAPRLSIAQWSHRSFAVGQAYSWFSGAVWDLHNFKRTQKELAELRILGFVK